MKLTSEKVAALVAESTKRQDVPDDGSPGLVLRVAGNGRWGTWCWRFGHGGRRVTFGRYPGLTLKQARDLASQQRTKVGQGIDPLVMRREARAALTVAELAVRFGTDHIPRLGDKTQGEYRRLLNDHILPKLGPTKARDLDRPAVVRWHQALRKTPRQANHALAVLSKMMSLAELWGERAGNPCRGVPRFDESRRQRYLTPDELGRVAQAIPAGPAGDAIRICILTGLRIGETLALRWEWITGATVTIPAECHKAGRKKGAKTVPLADAAVLLLSSLQRSVGGHVVLATVGQVEYAWRRVRDASEIPDVHLHDLRHTFVSYGAASGISLPILGALVGHTQASTTQRYAHLSQSPLRDAVEQIGAALDAAMRRSISGS